METQPLLNLEMPPAQTPEDRMREVVRVVITQFGGDMAAYWEAIRPRRESEADLHRKRLEAIAV